MFEQNLHMFEQKLWDEDVDRNKHLYLFMQSINFWDSTWLLLYNNFTQVLNYTDSKFWRQNINTDTNVDTK